MSAVINILLVVGVVGIAIIGFQNRCEWFQLCNDGLGLGSASAAPTGDTTNNYYNDDGTVNGEVANPGISQSRGCCECKMVGDRVKCQKNGDGNWFNPPAGEGGSNDQDIGLSLIECYKTCSGSTTTATKSSSSGSSKMPSNGSKESSVQNKPKTGNLGDKGTKYVKPTVKATGSASYLNNTAPKGKSLRWDPKTGKMVAYYGGNPYLPNREYEGPRDNTNPVPAFKSFNASIRFGNSRLSL